MDADKDNSGQNTNQFFTEYTAENNLLRLNSTAGNFAVCCDAWDLKNIIRATTYATKRFFNHTMSYKAFTWKRTPQRPEIGAHASQRTSDYALGHSKKPVHSTFTHATTYVVFHTGHKVRQSRNTREKADYSTFYVSAIIFKGVPRN
jgi:hypothetical protein